MSEVFNSVVDAIGNTPLVALDRITAGLDGRILAKLDYLNPGFSKKDRPALQIIDDAEASGTLRPGQTVVELTSGNMGAGLAIVCQLRGYPFVAVMSRGNSEERARMMRGLNAEVVLVDQAPGSIVGEVSGEDLALVEDAVNEIVQKRDAFRADQFRREASRRAHYTTTGPEFWHQSGHTIDAFCDFAGSGGTFAGCSQYFKEQEPSIKCYLVEPAGAAALAGERIIQPTHPIQGGGYGMERLELLSDVVIDDYIKVTGEQARYCARRLAAQEGIFAGYSSGANLAAAMQLLEGQERGRTIAIVICDSGLKYLSTNLWD